MENIIYFNKSLKKVDDKVRNRLGIRGRRAVDLAQMGFPIVPGFIIDSELTQKLNEVNLKQMLKSNIATIEKEMGKVFGDPSNPLLLKVVLSSDLNVPFFPSIHNIGLNNDTVRGFAKSTEDETFAYGEFAFLLKSIGTKLLDVEPGKFSDSVKKTPEQLRKGIESDKKILEANFYDDVYDQLSMILKKAAEKYCDSDIDVDNSLTLMVQAMVYGNLGKNSFSGYYYTRDMITGNNEIQGLYLQNEFDVSEKNGKTINNIDKKYFDKLAQIGRKVEEEFREIRHIKFTIEEGNLWLVEQREVDEKSTQAHLATLIDLKKKKIVDSKYIINHMKPVQLNELLHPIIDPRTIKGIKSMKGGISGSSGAAIGKVYFSTEKLLEEYKKAMLHGEDTSMILVMEATYAEDVKAIEVAQGVISTEGGFSSHAPVVARSLGKVATVQPDMKIKGNTFTIQGQTVKEGEYISLNVPFYDVPTLYLGKVGLIEPDFDKNGLFEFVKLTQEFVGDFDVRVNADQPREAALARQFLAQGVGLCRTEHMFFNEKRIMKFRQMILAQGEKNRRKVLDELRPMQRSDFYELFKIMNGLPVTIRLLDAPLHEFLPRSEAAMKEFLAFVHQKDKTLKLQDVASRCEELHEMNPMLGHRGCRVAITYPEIYEMQCRAIFESACMLKKEGVNVKPEIMIPIVMSEQELKFIKNGKKIEGTTVKGIRDIKNEVCEEYGIKDIEYKVGSMIELPAAALRAGNIAQYAEFFSFGTNDLTQTTYGLSRDDSNSFFPSYTLYDLLQHNPFQVLGDEVKELIATASLRGRLTRPNIKIGLCGEHGADPENIRFCAEVGLNYVSCSPYSIPLAKLAIAQMSLAAEDQKK
ncbi:MAG: pyruvate, phosphate dikinase [Spirochaetes bacterium]|nr:pyruvate, phosphate dikinase [Spirochaetota bacterium]